MALASKRTAAAKDAGPSKAPVDSVTDIPYTVRCMSRVCTAERIIWAKLSGYRPWPARIISDSEREDDEGDFYEQADAFKRPEQDTLVIFFGTNDLAWLSKDKAIRPWKYGLRHDYQNMKTSSKAFRFAIKEVKKHCSEKSGKNFV